MFIKYPVLHLLVINGGYLEEEMATHFSILAGKFQEKTSLASYSPDICTPLPYVEPYARPWGPWMNQGLKVPSLQGKTEAWLETY